MLGILNIDKPAGITSRRVVDHVQRLVAPAKTGHAGTLDPLATGVLVVCVGKATRLVDLIQGQRKTYEAGFLLGRRSDTDDVTGNVTELNVSREITCAEIESLLPTFTGRIEQTPPAFSAVHVRGARAYQRSRRGEAVALSPRPVEVYRLELTRFAYPELDLKIECGSGTYIRSIGRDLGLAVGCGAVLSTLVRTRIGPFTLSEAVALNQLSAENIGQSLLPPSMAIQDLPQFRADEAGLVQIRAGRPIDAVLLDATSGTSIAVLDIRGELACLAEFDSQRRQLLPRRVFLD